MNVNEDNYRDLMPEDIQGAVNAVKHGFDPVAADNLICYFHYMLRDGHLFDRVQLKPVERAFVEYVAHAFKRIAAEGKSTKVAFGLGRGRGEYQRADTSGRDYDVAAYLVLHIRNGTTPKAANIDAENFFKCGATTVTEAYARHRQELESMPDEYLEGVVNAARP